MGQPEPGKTKARGEDPISVDTFKKRLVELGLRSGMSGFPRRPRDRHILLKSIVLTLDPKRYYSEAELDAKLERWLREVGRSIRFDRVRLRRMLIDEGYMGRERDGSRYWVGILGPPLVTHRFDFEPEIDALDVMHVIAEGEQLLRLKKQRYANGER